MREMAPAKPSGVSRPPYAAGGASLHLGLPLFGIGAPVLAEDLGEPVAAFRASLRCHGEEVGHAGARRIVAHREMRPEREEPIPEAALLGVRDTERLRSGLGDGAGRPIRLEASRPPPSGGLPCAAAFRVTRRCDASATGPRPVKWCASEGTTVHRWARFRLP